MNNKPETSEYELTPQEQHLVNCAARGEWWFPELIDEEIQLDFDPAYAYGWAGNRTIRAEIIACLATGETWRGAKAPWPVNPKGLMVAGARVTGALDLQGATISRKLSLHHCAFDATVNFADAELKTTSLRGSHLSNGLSAQGANIMGNLFLRDDFSAGGEVNLMGAKIEGQLDCFGGHFENDNGPALEASTMTVGGCVFLNHGFSARGGVNLVGTRIEGQLACSGGHFENDSGPALNANLMTVGASVLLNSGFRARGEVNLMGAKIEGQLACDRGHFENGRGRALNADAMTVSADVFLRDGFLARGEVNLVRAKIDGNLRCQRAHFSNKDGIAIILTHARIGAGLIFRDLRPSEGDGPGLNGRLVLEQATCRTYRDDPDSWPEPGKLVLDGFTYERFHNCATDCETRREWLRRQTEEHLDGEFRPQPWTQAIKVLREMGHDRDARELAIAREKARALSDATKRKKWPRWKRWTTGLLDRAWSWILWATIAYGYKPWRTLYWSAGFIIFGWLVFASAANLGFMAPRDGTVITYLARASSPPIPKAYTRFDALAYAADAFVPLIELNQTQAWKPIDDQHGFVRQLAPDQGFLACTRRLVLGQNMEWTKTAPPHARSCGFAADTGWLSYPTATAAWFFRGGFHRFVGWIEEIFGWVFITLFIAGMSGLMKKE